MGKGVALALIGWTLLVAAQPALALDPKDMVETARLGTRAGTYLAGLRHCAWARQPGFGAYRSISEDDLADGLVLVLGAARAADPGVITTARQAFILASTRTSRPDQTACAALAQAVIDDLGHDPRQ
ncbi:hypothetical protein [Rhodospirillum rubrum]|uniref:Rap1a immunity protein domain-containing protein n=1 Tax=Rhodospirillum rubrum (strain ATCC 11170 / ATH 1.1.1 / DSM 467 / LMG 4362 / NCIMB 8255 / S1) TaxID=269796 RepID=Q2RVN0_RHORT|nr:hypothetical protein [Rhodospirillum rubrum]ABC21815.1 hypothetical protein Rru_A1014 [Rhodospirillum rubrum ATCC 11170]AEO47515.1 hypothetical protein F11_05225 [Rhodospirillum rubrum F11]MBK5953372.1 hypothetical protein [Rhodospirillum rubrum]QXG81477.1 hypothetical protein KUL73_05285 [Rhodospirillum rubrum]HAQ01324.1 hypothetical protein [Rhodospirillum rubrum]